MDKIAGYLEVGVNDNGEVVVNHPDLTPDENGVGHIVFSPAQALNLAQLLWKHAKAAEVLAREKMSKLRMEAAVAIPVDRAARVLTDGSPVTPDHCEINPATGQQRNYVVLTPEERSKGFVRPVRRTYTHVGRLQEFENPDHPSGETQRWKQRIGGCGADTTMSVEIAETYARDPKFYSGTFCIKCRAHLPLNEFVWRDTEEQVGS